MNHQVWNMYNVKKSCVWQGTYVHSRSTLWCRFHPKRFHHTTHSTTHSQNQQTDSSADRNSKKQKDNKIQQLGGFKRQQKYVLDPKPRPKLGPRAPMAWNCPENRLCLKQETRSDVAGKFPINGAFLKQWIHGHTPTSVWFLGCPNSRPSFCLVCYKDLLLEHPNQSPVVWWYITVWS